MNPVGLDYATRFFIMMCHELVANDCDIAWATYLADPQFNVFHGAKGTFKTKSNFEMMADEFITYAKHGNEPSWHQQAREIIENRQY